MNPGTLRSGIPAPGASAVGGEPGVGTDWVHVTDDTATAPAELNGTTLAKWLRRLTVAIALLALTNAALAVGSLLGPPQYNPLGDYPMQQIINGETDDLTGLPGFALGDVVVVRGTKCNDTAMPVDVFGVLTWARIDPPGRVVRAFEGTGLRPPGCDTRVFRNDMPELVQTDTAALFDAGFSSVTWRIAGWDEPLTPEGETGVVRTWRTEDFVIVPTG